MTSPKIVIKSQFPRAHLQNLPNPSALIITTNTFPRSIPWPPLPSVHPSQRRTTRRESFYASSWFQLERFTGDLLADWTQFYCHFVPVPVPVSYTSYTRSYGARRRVQSSFPWPIKVERFNSLRESGCIASSSSSGMAAAAATRATTGVPGQGGRCGGRAMIFNIGIVIKGIKLIPESLRETIVCRWCLACGEHDSGRCFWCSSGCWKSEMACAEYASAEDGGGSRWLWRFSAAVSWSVAEEESKGSGKGEKNVLAVREISKLSWTGWLVVKEIMNYGELIKTMKFKRKNHQNRSKIKVGKIGLLSRSSFYLI